MSDGSDVKATISPEELHQRMNGAFQTNVVLQRSRLPEAALQEDWFDVAYCISTLEHFDHDDITETLRALRRILRPGGLFIVTVDLFLDLAPFCSREKNQWGANLSIPWLVAESGMTLVDGNLEELNGFPEFSADRVLCQLDDCAVNSRYPQLAQMFVLQN